jgi:uncharacterized damage-inducible protein DinB
MKLHEFILKEFQQEMGSTRKTLERIPETQWEWTPHQKSWQMGELATHIANLPSWTPLTIDNDSLDIAPPGSEPPRTSAAGSLQEVLERFDHNCREAESALAGSSDEHLLKPWTMLSGGQVVFTMPRIVVIQSFIVNHSVHHRAQLCVYLRLNNVPVPSIYGPSADE